MKSTSLYSRISSFFPLGVKFIHGFVHSSFQRPFHGVGSIFFCGFDTFNFFTIRPSKNMLDNGMSVLRASHSDTEADKLFRVKASNQRFDTIMTAGKSKSSQMI